MRSMPFDKEALFFDAEDTSSWAIANHDSSGTGILDLGAADADEDRSAELQVKWPGLSSGGSATVQFIVQDSADGATGFADVAASEIFTYDDADVENFRMPLPKQGVKRYVRLRVAVAGAVLNGGALTAGLVKTA